jgi:sporulation protein YlmC with PRC-barrel domain
MAESMPFTIGATATCTDGECGTVTRVVVDPVARAITHLVVQPKHRYDAGRLVPVDLVDAKAGEMQLGCTLAEFEMLDLAEETQFLPGISEDADYVQDQVLSWAYYDLASGPGMPGGVAGVPQPVTYDSVPLGEVEVRRGEHVHATDGEIGRVQGLVIDRRTHLVTHVLLQEGHLWGRKEVAIPIPAVTGVEDGIRLNLTKQQVQDLPPVDIDHPTG